MKYVIVTPGGTVQYDIPIMKVQAYSLDDIFEKRLLMLIPFYIFSHEKDFAEYEGNAQKMEKLKSEYQDILERLNALEQQQIIGAFDKRTIIELTRDVIKEISQKYEHVQKGVGDIMGGALIETEARRLRDKAAAKATREAAIKMALKLLQMGKLTIEEITVCSGLTVIEIENLKNMQPI